MVRFFDGDERAAFVLAVEANISHGLPLTFADRIAAAERILMASPQWSDRAVAAKAGLAAGTVAGIRQRLPAASDQPSARVGKDGRVRPLNYAAGRRLASALMAERPDATLREIAREAGISAATALDVRTRLGRGEDPVPRRQRESEGSGLEGELDRSGVEREPERSGLERRRAPTSSTRVPNLLRGTAGLQPAAILERMRRDPSLRYNEKGRGVLGWLAAHALGIDRWREYASWLPPHCMVSVAELSRVCADMWTAFAEDLEYRVKNVSGGELP
jgi:hypothetical protein